MTKKEIKKQEIKEMIEELERIDNDIENDMKYIRLIHILNEINPK